MKYRAVANGNLVDNVPESLVTAGIYVRVDDTPARPAVPEPEPDHPAPEPEPERKTALRTPEAPLLTVAHTAPAEPAPAPAPRQRGRPRKK